MGEFANSSSSRAVISSHLGSVVGGHVPNEFGIGPIGEPDASPDYECRTHGQYDDTGNDHVAGGSGEEPVE